MRDTCHSSTKTSECVTPGDECVNISRLYLSDHIHKSGDNFVELTTFPVTNETHVQRDISTDSLFSTLYSELHRLAKRQLGRQWSPIGVGVTTLLHEAYLNIVDRKQPIFPDQARFMG